MMALPGLPFVHEVTAALRPEEAFQRLAGKPYLLFLDSAQRHPRHGRYSFLAADPFALVEVAADGSDGLQRLAGELEAYRADSMPDLPPFQGGAAGLFSYDLGRSLERIPATRFDEFRLPALMVGLYDVILAFDHEQHRHYVISQGFPETDEHARKRRAEQRCREMLGWLETDGVRSADRSGFSGPRGDWVPAEALAPQYTAGKIDGLTSNFTAEGYQDAVRKAVEYIHAGDVFQVNLAQRILFPARDDSLALYLRLRERNPAPFAGYFDLGRFQIVSASPERFLRVREGQVETRPIKGTRQRNAGPEADLYAAADLCHSEKDHAENVMIVDLLRNDISRVCHPDSVRVTQLCGLERYQYVQHLVSAVVGELAPGRTAIDLIRATFPGGSITGAPKIRSMEIIAEIEPSARGAYCGAMGYIGFDQSMDLSILIRTVTAGRGWWQLPVGGGVVAQSDPRREYEETWHKATGLLHALQ